MKTPPFFFKLIVPELNVKTCILKSELFFDVNFNKAT